ncbi:serine hydrolase domain-containing protein [Pirellulaceae bacterium SH467]
MRCSFLGQCLLCVLCMGQPLIMPRLLSQDVPQSSLNPESPAIAESPEARALEISKQLERIRQQFEFPGMVCGKLTKHGEISIAVCGVAKEGQSLPLEKNSLLHLGSCTKSMTATLVALHVEEGKLKWDSSLKSLFPDIPGFQTTQWGDVTLDDLLEHTSGLPANAPWGKWLRAKDMVQARHEIADWSASLPWDEKKHGKFEYSNLGYMLLGHAIEQVEKRPWEEILRERIFAPLSMKSAGFGSPVQRKDYPVSWGHVRNDDASGWVSVDQDNPAVLGPAGTVHATMEDWCKYLRIHLMSPTDASFPLPIGIENWNRLHQSRQKTEYAGGWHTGKRDWANGQILTHNGSNTMWYCVVFLAPERGMGVFAAANVGLEASPVCDRALQLVLREEGLLANQR